MPKLQRWLIASKMVEVLDQETLSTIGDLGGQIGGGWSEVHQHICVNKDNKEQIEELLRSKGFTVTYPSDHAVYHPECQKNHQEEMQKAK